MAIDFMARALALNNSSPIKNFARFSRLTEQTGIVGGATPSAIIFNTTEVKLGTGITLNTSTGVVTLKSGATFKVEGTAGSVKLGTAACWGSWVWKYSVDGGTTWNNFGNIGESISSANTTWDAYSGSASKGAITTTTTTLIKLSMVGIYGSNTVGSLADTPNSSVLPWCEIQEI